MREKLLEDLTIFILLNGAITLDDMAHINFKLLRDFLCDKIAEAEKEAVREYDEAVIYCEETECVASGAVYKRLAVNEDKRKEALKKRVK